MFHSITGCDTVSFVHRKGKRTAFSLWEMYPEISDVFIRVIKNPVHIRECDFDELELYFAHLYDRSSKTTQFNITIQESYH